MGIRQGARSPSRQSATDMNEPSRTGPPPDPNKGPKPLITFKGLHQYNWKDGKNGSPSWVDLSRCSGLDYHQLAAIYLWMEQTSNRTDELRLLGNGVVPSTAQLAFSSLYAKLFTI